MKKNKRFPNFPDLYSFSDYKTVCDARNTFDCGLSPICLCAPSQHYSIGKQVLKEDSASASLNIRTLRLEYAIQVWIKAALISSDNPSELLYYWWLHYEDNETSFREVKYSQHMGNRTPEELNNGFWQLLREIADSGHIKVCEGFSYTNPPFCRFSREPNIKFYVTLDVEDTKDVHKEFDDIFNHPYNKTLKTYTWEQIKDLFIQLDLKQLSLIDLKQLHKHSKIDKMLFSACDILDFAAVKMAVERGADVNALDENGESALSHTLDYFTEHGMIIDEEYSVEEEKAIIQENYKKCIKIVDYLLDLGADIDLFGVNGMQPITHAYYARSLEMVEHLLKRGSNPNYNSYRCDDVRWCTEDSCRCTILNVIGGMLAEEYDDFAKEVEMLIHKYGGRIYAWDYDVARQEHIGRYYVTISPYHEKYLFFDNAGWGIGDENEITIEDVDGNQTKISLVKIEGLREWHEEYINNLENSSFDWQEWNARGYRLARFVVEQLPSSVALFYPYPAKVEWRYNSWNDKHYLESLREETLVV